MNRTILVVGAGAVAIAAAGFLFLPKGSRQDTGGVVAAAGGPIVKVTVPEFDGNAAIGRRIFDSACATCHGADAVGKQGVAPPLVHKYYEPSHHGDEAFQRAVAMGVRAHHWQFGDMPPIEGMTRGDVAMVTAYIRQLQRANGIH